MIILPLLLQGVLCAVILHREVLRYRCANYATVIFYATYGCVYIAVPLVIHLWFGGAFPIARRAGEPFTDPLLYAVFNAIGLALLTTGFVISLSRAKPPERSAESVQTNNLADVIGILVAAGLPVFVYSTGSGIADLLTASRFAWFGNANFQVGLNVAAAYLIALTPIYVYLVARRAPHSKLLLPLVLSSVVLYGFITKDRKWLFFVTSGILAALYHRRGNRLTIGARGIATGAVLIPIIILSQILRDAMAKSLNNEEVEFFDEFSSWADYLFTQSDLSYFYRATIEAIHQNINHDVLILLGLPRRLLFFFLPSSWSGGLKVEDIAALFSDVVEGGDSLRRGNMPPGLFGLFVLSFGWAGSVVVAPLVAMGLPVLDRVFRGRRSMLQLATISIFPSAVIFAFRGDESTSFYFVASNLIVVGVCSKVFRRHSIQTSTQ